MKKRSITLDYDYIIDCQSVNFQFIFKEKCMWYCVYKNWEAFLILNCISFKNDPRPYKYFQLKCFKFEHFGLYFTNLCVKFFKRAIAKIGNRLLLAHDYAPLMTKNIFRYPLKIAFILIIWVITKNDVFDQY